MLKSRLVNILCFVFLSSASVLASEVCMLESDAELYGCSPKIDVDAYSACKNRFGDEYRAYHVSDRCSVKLSYELMGGEYEGEIEEYTEAACFKFEEGIRNNCSYWDYEAAKNYCSLEYGDRFLPHIISKECSVEKADQVYGFISPEHLTADLTEMLDEANAILTMLDREGFQKSFMGLVSFRPVIKNEFYSPVVKGLLAKLTKINRILEKRSYLKVKFLEGNSQINEFKKMLHFYQSMVVRVHKLYAYVAHRNHKTLDTYNFQNLSFLNLKLSKVFTLELLAQVNYKVKTLDHNKFEILQLETDKQHFEYMALSEPNNKEDYAKLVTFLGIRENLLNLWAVDSLTEKNLLNGYGKSCGNFMSFQTNGDLSKIPTIVESSNYENYVYDYLENVHLMVKAIDNFPLATESDSKFLVSLLGDVPELRKLLEYNYGDSLSKEVISQHFAEDMKGLMEVEKLDWESYSSAHFKTILMPGDFGQSISVKSEIISNHIFLRKLKSFKEGFIGLYPWLSNKGQLEIEQKIDEYLRSKEGHFKKNLNKKLRVGFNEIERGRKNYSVKREERVAQVLEISKEYLPLVKKSLKLEENILTDVKPSTFEQLMLFFETRITTRFQDVKLTLNNNPELAKELSQFFSLIAKDFNEKYLIRNIGENPEITGSNNERSHALWELLVEHARDIYLEKDFEIKGLATIPLAVNLARDRNELIRNPYTIPIFKDGTVAGTMHINELYEAFQEKIRVKIPSREIIMRTDYMFGIRPLFELDDRNNSDLISQGFLDRPKTYISADGEVVVKGISSDIGYDSLKRLYLSSLDLTKFEIKENLKVQKNKLRQKQDVEGEEYEGWWITEGTKYLFNRINGDSVQEAQDKRRKRAMSLKAIAENKIVIKSSQKLFSRVFEVFNLPLVDLRSNKNIGSFLLSLNEQKAIVKNELSKAYISDALLRKEIIIPQEVEKWFIPPYNYAQPQRIKVTEKRERTLIKQLALHAYDEDSRKVDMLKAKGIVDSAITDVAKNIQGNINHFCNADYLNLKDPSFRKTFKASKFLRLNLKSEHGTTPVNAKKIRALDKIVQDEIRTKMEAVNEDYLEPGLLYLGVATLVALAIILPVGGMIAAGVAVPAGIAGTVGLAGAAMSSLNYIFFAMIVASSSTRLNSQLIKVPAQLQFQQSIAHSQIQSSKLADYDFNRQEKKSNQISAMISIGLMPLDIWFGHSIVTQIRSATGHSGVNALSKLTGIKINKYSSPPKSMRMNTGFRSLKNEYGVIGGIYQKSKNAITNLKMKLPKFQMIPEEFLGISSLKIGIARKFKEIGIHNKPWVIMDDLSSYHKSFKNRFHTYKQFSLKDKDLIERYMLNDGLRFGEIFENGINGLKNTKLIFRLHSEIKAIREGRFFELRQNYGVILDDLRHLQGELLKQKYKDLDSLALKVKNFQQIRGRDEQIITANTELTDDFLKLLSESELVLLGQISKKSKGILSKLKPVYKQYDLVGKSLRPMSYLYGKPNVEFSSNSNGKEAYTFLDDRIDSSYVFRSETEDLVTFYESMIRQSGKDSELIKRLRKPIEEQITELFILDQYGNRIYFNP